MTAAAHKSHQHDKVRCPSCAYEFSLDELGKPRSTPQLRRYMALCRKAFENWPSGHPERPQGFVDAHECRKWLEMKAGYATFVCEAQFDGELPAAVMTAGMEAALRSVLVAATPRKTNRGRPVAFPKIHGDRMLIFISQSVAYEEMTHKQFTDLATKVETLIYEHTGIDTDNGYRAALEATA
jgi:hypothetical protein